MTTAVLSIGSNLGDRMARLRSVVDGLGDRVVAVSPVYRTAPWGGVDQADFLNAVVLVEDDGLDGYDWLRHAQQLEDGAERVRDIHWGPRTLDVDIIAVDAITSDDPILTLPHPQAHRRAFVMVPWLDVQPNATLRVDGAERSVAHLLAALDPAEVAGVHRFPEELR